MNIIELSNDTIFRENVGMLSASTREACLTDFLNGMPLSEIAKKHRVSKRTVERWSAAEHWIIRRRQAWNTAKQGIIAEHASGRIRSDLLASEAAFDIFQRAHEEFVAYMEGRIPKKALRFSTRQWADLARAFYHANFADRLNLINAEASLICGDEFATKPAEGSC